MKTGQRSKAVVHAFARCSVGLAGLGGFVLAWSLWAALSIIAQRVPVPAEVLPWGVLITSVVVLVVASASAIWRPSSLPALTAFFGGALLLMPASLFWLFRLNASS